MSDEFPMDADLGHMNAFFVMSPIADNEKSLFLAVNYVEKEGYEQDAKNLRDNVRNAMEFFQEVSARMRSAPIDLSQSEQRTFENLMSEVEQVSGHGMSGLGPVVAAVAVRRVSMMQEKLEAQKKTIRDLEFALTSVPAANS